MSNLGDIKWQMAVDRGGRYPLCDGCDEKHWWHELDLHHIVSRGRTVSNREAREASECKELFALLCPNCHSKAHQPAIAAILLSKNIKRYGRFAVKRAFMSALKNKSATGGIPFPPMKIRRLTYGKEKRQHIIRRTTASTG